MSVVVVPRFFVDISAVLRGDPFERGAEVMVDQPRFEFCRGDARCGSDDEDGGRAAGDCAIGEAPGDVIGDVQDFVVALGVYLEFVGLNGHARSVAVGRRVSTVSGVTQG